MTKKKKLSKYQKDKFLDLFDSLCDPATGAESFDAVLMLVGAMADSHCLLAADVKERVAEPTMLIKVAQLYLRVNNKPPEDMEMIDKMLREG